MHDFYLAKEIIELAKQEAEEKGLAKIKKINIELGEIVEHGESINPENLKYNINLLIPCEVEIKRIKGDRWRLVSIEG